jgi:prepilin-type N-terminal cleavage/methylation domain-containing protein
MATSGTRRLRRASGYTLIEIMFVVAIIAMLAATAIPLFLTYQFRTRSAEAKINLGALRVLEHSYFAVHDQFLPAAPEPPVIPGNLATLFSPNAGFDALGFRPEGQVYFSYGVAVSADGAGYTADAAADIDADGFPQFWGFARPDGGGALTPGQVGCNVAGLAVEQVGPCDPSYGKSVF